MSNEQWAMSSEQWAVSSEQGGVRSFRYSCFHQHSYSRLANIQPFPNPPTPPAVFFPPSSATPLPHCSLLTAHCSLLIASHRRTVAFIAIACRENQYCKTKRKIIKKYKILIINMLYNIIIYNNIIYFYSIVSFSAFSSPNVRTGLMWRCGGVAVWRMSSEQSNEQLAISN